MSFFFFFFFCPAGVRAGAFYKKKEKKTGLGQLKKGGTGTGSESRVARTGQVATWQEGAAAWPHTVNTAGAGSHGLMGKLCSACSLRPMLHP